MDPNIMADAMQQFQSARKVFPTSYGQPFLAQCYGLPDQIGRKGWLYKAL